MKRDSGKKLMIYKYLGIHPVIRQFTVVIVGLWPSGRRGGRVVESVPAADRKPAEW